MLSASMCLLVRRNKTTTRRRTCRESHMSIGEVVSTATLAGLERWKCFEDKVRYSEVLHLCYGI